MRILIDVNIEGLADLLLGTLTKEGWVGILGLEFIYFGDTTLASDSDDTSVWRFAQSHGFILLTDNRNEEDETSLTATIRRENTPTSLPTITIANAKRLKTSAYRQEVALKLAEILLYLENYLGTGRVFIP